MFNGRINVPTRLCYFGNITKEVMLMNESISRITFKDGGSRPHGFTLIELLVVIAIIAILAAILFPVFAKVREKARQTACLSNEKQLGLGLMQYTEDYDEKTPGGTFQFPPYGPGWAGQVYPYVKSAAVFLCPDETPRPNSVPSSYAFNFNCVDQSTIYDGISIASFAAPASTVMLCEVQGNNVTVGPGEVGSPVADGLEGDYDPGGWDSCAGTCDSAHLIYSTGYLGGHQAASIHFQSATGRHTGGSNFLMSDGHAKWLRGAAVSPGHSPLSSTAAENDTTNYAAGTGGNIGSAPAAATFSIN